MKEYEITLTTRDGRRLADTIRATSSFDARRAIQGRYPGCTIWSIKVIG